LNKNLSLALKLFGFLIGLWLVISSFEAELNYGQLALGLLLLWACAFWAKGFWEANHGPVGGWPGWALSSLLAIIPGLILLAYGLLAPAQPSLTNSGLDVCALQTGWCVSGTRAFAFFGAAGLLAGLAWSYFLYTLEKKTGDR
jgi:hypothetical protein